MNILKILGERGIGGGETVMHAEDGDARPLARLSLRRAIGLGLPRHWYHVGCTVHAAPELSLFHRQSTLLLGNDHTGATEIAELAWTGADAPLSERATVMRTLLDGAMLTLAREREHYASRLIVELPGLRDAAGTSPFWAGLGRHFYAGDPQEAQARHGKAWLSHVAALLPRHPVIAGFLPAAAQAAIAQVAPEARWLRELLESAGLRYGHHIGIGDGGPVLEADLDALPVLLRARAWRLEVGAEPGTPHLVLNAQGLTLRSTATARGTHLVLPARAMATLGLSAGDSAWALPLRGEP
jgi:arginine N-succinyltransferase